MGSKVTLCHLHGI